MGHSDSGGSIWSIGTPAASSSATDGGKDVRAVLAGADGRLLWRGVWEQRRDVAYYGTDALVEVRGGSDDNAVVRVDLRTGRQRWRRPGNSDLLGMGEHRLEPWSSAATAGVLVLVVLSVVALIVLSIR